MEKAEKKLFSQAWEQSIRTLITDEQCFSVPDPEVRHDQQKKSRDSSLQVLHGGLKITMLKPLTNIFFSFST
jgi:hypothetical protein